MQKMSFHSQRWDGKYRTQAMNQDHWSFHIYLSQSYLLTCTLYKKLYIGETGRRLGDRFREQPRGIEKEDKNAFKPVSSHFNLPNHS